LDRQVYTLSPEGKAALKQARNVDLDAPNEADEPWYLGQSAALVNLAKRCG
jgi:DNA-binding PadR family transcriptional regulator